MQGLPTGPTGAVELLPPPWRIPGTEHKKKVFQEKSNRPLANRCMGYKWTGSWDGGVPLWIWGARIGTRGIPKWTSLTRCAIIPWVLIPAPENRQTDSRQIHETRKPNTNFCNKFLAHIFSSVLSTPNNPRFRPAFPAFLLQTYTRSEVWLFKRPQSTWCVKKLSFYHNFQ